MPVDKIGKQCILQPSNGLNARGLGFIFKEEWVVR